MEAAGRTPKNDKWKDKYSEPAEFTGDTHEIPESWQWISFDEITASVLYGPRFGTDEYDPQGIPTVRTTDMDFYGNIRMTNAPCVVIVDRQRNHFLLKADDLVITRTGATIGKAALFDEAIGDAIASAYLIRYRFTSATLIPKFLLYFLMSPHGQAQLIGGTQAVAQPNINTKTIAALSVPLPPYDEQKQIVDHLDDALRSSDAMLALVAESESALTQLDQSILAKAFRGELVPQDPNDEPASVLLERIRAEREANSKTPKKTKTRTRSTEFKEESARASTDLEPLEEAPSNNESKRDADEQTVVPIDEIDRDDVMALIRDVFEEYEELDRDDAIHEVSHKLGYKRTGSQIRDILSDDIRTAMRRGILYSDNGMYRLGCQSIDDYKRDELIKYLLSAMGRTWWEQQDAIREATRHLGFRRTGKKIQQAFESAINGAIRRDLLERDGQSLRRL